MVTLVLHFLVYFLFSVGEHSWYTVPISVQSICLPRLSYRPLKIGLQWKCWHASWLLLQWHIHNRQLFSRLGGRGLYRWALWNRLPKFNQGWQQPGIFYLFVQRLTSELKKNSILDYGAYHFAPSNHTNFIKIIWQFRTVWDFLFQLYLRGRAHREIVRHLNKYSVSVRQFSVLKITCFR